MRTIEPGRDRLCFSKIAVNRKHLLLTECSSTLCALNLEDIAKHAPLVVLLTSTSYDEWIEKLSPLQANESSIEKL